MDSHDEIPLSGGHLSTVVRVGDTVRRPTGPWTPAVHALLRHLERAGYRGAPRVLGIDDRGREILCYIPGEVPFGDHPPGYLWSDQTLTAAAHLLRQYHDAAASFTPPEDAAWQIGDTPVEQAEIICHNDCASWNTVFRDGSPVAFIDWDLASPGLKVWDVAYVLWHFVPMYDNEKCLRLGCDASTNDRARRLRGFSDAYGWPSPGDLLPAVIQRQRRARNRIWRLAQEGRTPYIRLWQSGVGDAILRDVAFVEDQAPALARYLEPRP
jgi:Phosphotransferase enzyme family